MNMQTRFLIFCQENRDQRIPDTENYKKRHFLRMRQIETFANEHDLEPSRAVIAYFSKIHAVEKACQCRIFECVRNCPERPEFMINHLEIDFLKK